MNYNNRGKFKDNLEEKKTKKKMKLQQHTSALLYLFLCKHTTSKYKYSFATETHNLESLSFLVIIYTWTSQCLINFS